MVGISGAWLDPQKDRPLLEKLPHVQGLVPPLEKAHQNLLLLQASPEPASLTAALSQLQEDAADDDATHDSKARGGFGMLGDLAELANDPAARSVYIQLRDKMYPNGLRVVQLSYAEEAGEVELVEQRLTKEDRDLLASIPSPDGNLLKSHELRVAAGRRLGEFERKRAEIFSKIDGTTVVKGPDVTKARNAWLRATRALVFVLELEDLDADTKKRLIGPLTDACDKIAKRSPRKKADKTTT